MKPVTQEADNPLGYQKESKLLINFAVPCIISMLVTALYNIDVYKRQGRGEDRGGDGGTDRGYHCSSDDL